MNTQTQTDLGNQKLYAIVLVISLFAMVLAGCSGTAYARGPGVDVGATWNCTGRVDVEQCIKEALEKELGRKIPDGTRVKGVCIIDGKEYPFDKVIGNNSGRMAGDTSTAPVSNTDGEEPGTIEVTNCEGSTQSDQSAPDNG